MNAPMGAAGLETAALSPLARAGLEAAEPTSAELADAMLLEAELLAAFDEPDALPDSLNLYSCGWFARWVTRYEGSPSEQ